MKNCVVCGREIEAGIACDQCDPPRGSKQAAKASGGPRRASGRQATARAAGGNVVPFPGEGSGVLLRAAWDVLTAADIPAVVIARNGRVRFVADSARTILRMEGDEELTRQDIEQKIGWRLPKLSETLSSTVEVGGREIEFSLVPLAEGSQGSVLLFRTSGEALDASAMLEKVVAPLQALRQALAAAKRHRETNPLLDDTAATIDRILGELEQSSDGPGRHSSPSSIQQIIHQVASRYAPIAQLKGISLESDVPPLEDVIESADELRGLLEALVENSLRYVPSEGQIFIGARTTTHRKKLMALFFVMDNGPRVPENLRQRIFEKDFEWEEAPGERTGRRLHDCFDFATRQGGHCWVECKSEKICTFFLSLRLS